MANLLSWAPGLGSWAGARESAENGSLGVSSLHPIERQTSPQCVRFMILFKGLRRALFYCIFMDDTFLPIPKF